MTDEISMRRLYIGGLFHGATCDDVKERFGKFGNISNVSVKTKQDGNGDIVNTFAYVDIDISEKNLRKCTSMYNRTKWKGRELKLQLAKESFVNRLKKELEGAEEVPELVVEENAHEKLRDVRVKGAPGTKVESMKDWVVAKYGRVLPVVHLRRKDKKKVIRIDPSKHCHAVKQLADDAADDERVKHVDELTWQLDDNSGQQASPAVDNIQSKRVRKLNNSSSKKEEKRKQLQQPTTKSNTSQRHAETQHLSAPELDRSLNETAKEKKKQKNSSKCDVEKLSNDKKLKHTVNFSDHDYKTRDSIQTKLQLSGVEEAMGIVSFTGEGEVNDLSATHRQSQQDSVYSEFKCAVIDEYVDKERSRNTSGVSNRERSDSSDEDAFDLIASGRINTLIWQSPRSCSKHGSSEASESYHQRDQSSAVTRVRYEQKAMKRPIENMEVEGYDSASSADTDVIIRSNRLMSHVMTDLRNQADGSFCPNPDTASELQNGQRHLPSDRENISMSRNLAEDGLNTQRKQRRKRSAGGDSEAGHSGVEEHLSGVDDGIRRDSCRGDERKRKQRSTKVDQSEDGLKSCDERTTVESVCDDNDRSNLRRHEADENKKIESNLKRINSLKSKAKFESSQKSIIQQALSNIDASKYRANRITFDSDSDADVAAATDDVSLTEPANLTQSDKQKMLLFDNDEDDEDSEADDNDNELRIRPEFAGPQGSKLLELQRRIGNDSRFQLDSRFCDEQTVDSNISDPNMLAEMSRDSEQAATLQVLRSVVPCSTRSKHKDVNCFRNTAQLRYDPTTDDTQHRAELKPATTKRTKKKSNCVELSSTSELPTLPATKFFDVTPSLKKIFDRTDEPFCLFGSSDTASRDVNETHEDDDEYRMRNAVTELSGGHSNESVETDFSGSESGSEDNKQQPTGPTHDRLRQTFFISPNDVMDESLQFFSRKSEVSNIRDRWRERRMDLIKVYRQRHKDALRRNTSKTRHQRQPQHRS